MPLLKKKPFEKVTEPKGLSAKDEVFHCTMTNEIFRDYDEFCQRVILCNSMVWTCCMTGKSGLTYTEAIESEEHAQEVLKDVPTELRIPLLFLASKTQRTSFLEMAEDIFIYAKDRYFVGENVEASFTGNKWRESHILQVIAPTEEKLKELPKNGQAPDRNFFPPASLYRYEVEQLDVEDKDVSEVMIVDCDHIKRKKSYFTRDKCKLFLKQFVEYNSQGVIVIKDSVLENHGIPKMKFDQIFDGPLPNFDTSRRLLKNPGDGKKVRQETLAQFLSKNNGAIPFNKEVNSNLLEKMKQRQEEFEQMRLKQIEERNAEKLRQKEENVQISLMLREWYKPKEDLELEDLKVLPVPAPVKTKVPDEYMGDVLAIIEFVHTFLKPLHFRDFFPEGLTVELMERALMQKEVAGPFMDVIQMFLVALFNVQNEEASQYSTTVEESSGVKDKDVNDNISLTQATHFATMASKWSLKHQGLPLNQLPLYYLTTTEVLRLHLLSSGARIKDSGAKWRFHNRGGYTSEDDPGLYLRLKYPHILKSLAHYNIIELSTGDKLRIIHCLMDQLLTYADIRDIVEDRLEKNRQARLELKLLQTSERKREQEIVANKLKIKREGKEQKKDMSVELDKLNKEAERRKIIGDKKTETLLKQATNNVVFLGHDRAFRKYFKLESIPGIFVNFEEENPGYCFTECIPQNSDLVGADRSQTLLHIREQYRQEHKEKPQDDQKEPKKINGIRKSLLSEVDHESLLTCTTQPSTCIVHSNTVNKQKWTFYHTEEQLEELINSLNVRGIRESELKQAILNEKEQIRSLMAFTPVTALNAEIEVPEGEHRPRSKKSGGKPKYDDPFLGYSSELQTQFILQMALVDNILEMEEKIYAGNLGEINVKDRNAWRQNMNNSKFELLEKSFVKKEDSKEYKDPGEFLGSTVDEKFDNDESLLHLSANDKVAIEALAICLIQVAQGIESRHLKKPLGHEGMRGDAKKNERYDVLDKWQQSLLQATSYSQIFLHFSILDNCIMWSRSALLARCTICRRQTDSENMLLCDSCNKGHHLYCLKPKLTSVPKEDWFCKDCQKQKDKEAKQKNAEVKPEPQRKRRIFKDESDDETSEQSSEMSEPIKKRRVRSLKESEDESANSSEALEEEEDEDMEETEEEEMQDVEMEEKRKPSMLEVCSQCGSGGTLLCCDLCPNLYHLECVEPPMRRVPRGKWYCFNCKSKQKKKESRDRKSGKVSQQQQNIQRQCASKARHKIHDFAKSLRRISDSEDSDSNSNEESPPTRRSNRREVDNRDDLPLHNATLQELLADVLKQEDAWPFVRPVLKVEVPDYYDIITKPMDFGTIRYKLNIGEYMCDAEVMLDAAQVFENCNTYNNSDDEVYKCGARLLKHFVDKCNQLGLQLPSHFDELQNEIFDGMASEEEEHS